MIKQIKSKKTSRFYARFLSLLVILSLLVTSGTMAIAVKSYRASHTLSQQTFTLTPEEGVTVTLNGLMPDNGYAEAKPAEADGEGVLHAYDITIHYAGGGEFEPAEDAPINVSFESAAIAEANANEDTSLAVEHITDDGEVEDIYLAFAKDDTAKFVAESFSVYIIREQEGGELKTPRKVFWFLDSKWTEYRDTPSEDSGVPSEAVPGAQYLSGLYLFPNTAGEMVSTQIVKDGEKLHPIVMPENYDWGSFIGWYQVELDLEASKEETHNETGEDIDSITRDNLTQYVYTWPDDPVQFNMDNEISVTGTEDTYVYLAPLFSRYRFVNFRDHERVGDGPSNIVARKLLVFGDDNQATVDISDVTADSPDAQSKVFFGWKFKNKEYQTRTASGETMASTITIAKDDLGENHYIDIYAVFKDAAWIYFVHGEKDWGAQYVGAIFSYLYDPANAPNDRVGIDQLPSTTRPGYVFDGWYTGHMDGEHIVYEQQVSMPLNSSSVTGDSAIITDGQTIIIDDKGTYISMGKLYLQNTLTLYAKWRPENTADYKVVIWRQNVSDDKNATDAEKTYDYQDYTLMEDQVTGSVILDTQAYKNKHFEELANRTDTNDPFFCCHYSRTEIVVNGHTYDGDIPAERVKGVVASDGSAVVNVYYDRDLMVTNFYYTNNNHASHAPDYAVTEKTYVYSEATSNSNADRLYGVVNDEYYKLTKTTLTNYYVYRYEYFEVEDFEDNRFGVVGNEYVPLNAVKTYKWMKTGGYYVKEQGTPSATKNYKGIVNGKFVALYYRTDDDGSYWTYGNNQRYSGQFYYEAMTGGDTSEYNGQRYVLNGDGVEATDSVTPEVQYAQDAQGNLYELQRESTGAVYYYNNTQYTGKRYERTEFERVQYDGTRYKKNADGSFSEAGNYYTGTLYGRENNDSPYEEIIKKTGPLTTYTYTDNGETKTYEGTVFAASTNSYTKRATWTGLFGQTIEQNHYNWNDVSSVIWRENPSSGTVQTLLDAFELAEYPYNLYSIGTTGNSNVVNHYKQKLNPDGTLGGYDIDEAYVAYAPGGSFNFTNKFLGFSVAAYSSSFKADGSGTAVKSGYQLQNPSNPLYVYHERKLYKVTLVDLRTDNNSSGLPKDQDVENIPYEAHISKYIDDGGYRTPPARENHTFGGWYFDKAFTKPADIDQITMGDGNLVLYAKWDLKYYFVEIDPNGGEMEDQTEFSQYTGITSPRKQSTYTWLRYGTKLSEYANVERSFVPDDTHGTYVYVNVKFAKTFDEAKDKNWDLRLLSQYRAAFYCPLSELPAVYNEHFAGLTYNGQQLITWDDFNDYCIDKGHKYRKAASYEGYTLVAWYKVNDDGTTSTEMYNFNDPVTKPTRIRAVWRRTGEYYIEYNPYMRQYHIGDVVTKNGQTYTNPVRHDPENPEEPTQVIDKYLDQSQVFILAAPSHIPEYYTFRGWQLLNPDGTIADVEPFYPTQEFTIDSAYADSNGRIRFEACYEPEPESARRVETAALILDANSGVAQRNGLPVYDEEKIYVDLQKDQVIFQKQPNNFEVTLADYYNNFLREDGYILIGWNKTRDKEGLDPDFAADAVIGVNNNEVDEEHPNILYAVWEPEYYLTLENHSTEYSVIFNLEFIGNGENNEGLVYCYAEEGGAPYDRHLLGDRDHPNMHVKKVSPNHFTIIMTPAADSENPNSEKLVIPEGANATYKVTGRILAPYTTLENSTFTLNDTGVINSNGQALNKVGASSFSVYNSGGAGERLTRGNYSSQSGVYRYTNIAGNRVTDYSVNGPIKLGREGQKVAFYTGATENVSVSIAARFYDPNFEGGKWRQETNTVRGPEATLTFNKNTLVGTETTNPPGVTNLDIIERTGMTFGIKETYSNTAYKFIGWYAKEEATPSDIPIDGVNNNPNAEINGLIVPNQNKIYYALYVPLADGNLNIKHNERATSAGYPKRMLVRADYPGTGNETLTKHQTVDTCIENVATRVPARVTTGITIPVKESDSEKYVTITLGSMSGYGSVYGNTYEGPDMLSRNVDENTDAHSFDEGGVVALLFYDPADAKMDENYNPDLPVGNGETKHLYKHIVRKKVADLFEDSETVKGYKVLNDLIYESDFARKYEFIYSYVFRDGTTQRKYCESGNTAVFASEESLKDFVAESAPYITNFGEELKWDYSSIRFDKLYDKGKIYAYMNSIQNKKQATVLVKTEGSGVTTRRQVYIGETFKEGELPTAELIMGNKQFYRWAITNTYTNQVIGYCYYHEFTFMVWQDITITAEYVPLKEDGEYHRYMPDNETEAYISIQHLDTTRNRWVALNEQGNIIRGAKDDPETYYDNLIDDYSILYVDHGKRINTNPDKYQVGLIYEIVGQITDESNPDVYSVTPNDSARQNAINYLLAHPEKTTGSLTYNGAKKFYYSQFKPAELTHDNRIEFYRGIDNLKNAGELNPNAKYVFNVYAYMKIKNENAEGNGYSDEGVVVQSSPVTLQLYRLAVKTTAKSN